MGAIQLMLPGKKIKKSNALARARWSPDSVWEPRLVAILAAQIRPGDTDFQTYEIRLVDILGKEPGGENYKILKEAVYKAMSRVIVINNGKGWSMYNIFSKCSLDSEKGTLEICFHPDLKEHYLQLKQYMQYNLLEFMLLPSIYSQRIFEFLKSWDDTKEVIISLDELHDMLDTPQSFRNDFHNFKARVVEKAHKDILKFTGLYYTWEPIKTGRAVSHIKFTFGKNQEIPIKRNGDIDTSTPDGAPIYRRFNSFLQKFPNGNSKRIEAHKEWNKLQDMGLAPGQEDVPPENQLGIMEFLASWQTSHAGKPGKKGKKLVSIPERDPNQA